ncbi:MAG: EF-hand domain-containing protein [Thermodesulfobacteriota bacterium]
MRGQSNWVFAGIFAFVLLTAVASSAEPIKAVSVKGFGEFGNDVKVVIDRIVPREETEFMDPTCVYWNKDDTYFVIDLGKVVQIEGITIQCDNNDDYRLEASEDGRNYSPLLDVSGDFGDIAFGMETISTLPGDPQYVPEAVMTPTRARYLKLSASGGDGAYAVSEVLIFGTITAKQVERPAPDTKQTGNLEQIFDAMDKDHDGRISLDEYAAIWKDKLDVRSNFAYFDKDQSGYIEKAEFLGLAEQLKSRKQGAKTTPMPEAKSPRAARSSNQTLPPALQGGQALKLDPEKVRNALAALREWPKLTQAAQSGRTGVIDEACRKYHFENWVELNMTVSLVCGLGAQLTNNPAAKDQLAALYGTEAVKILSTPQAREQLGDCPR